MTATLEPMTISAPAAGALAPARTPQTRRRLLAAAVLGAPVLLSINSAFHPAVEITADSLAAGASADPGRWYAVHAVAAVGAMLYLAAAVGLRTLVTGRGRRVADVALGLSLVGAPLLAMLFAAEASVLSLATELPDPARLALVEAYVTAPEFYAVPLAIALLTLGNLLMGVALVLSRSVPRWQAVTLCVAVVATAVGMPGTLLGPLAFGTVSVVSVFLALEVTRPRAAA